MKLHIIEQCPQRPKRRRSARLKAVEERGGKLKYCPICGFKFETVFNQEIVNHITKEHGKEMFWNCGNCRALFKTSRGLKKHEAVCEVEKLDKFAMDMTAQQVFVADYLHSCEFCLRVYGSAPMLRQHAANYHECHLCGQNFEGQDPREKLQKHKKEHELKSKKFKESGRKLELSHKKLKKKMLETKKLADKHLTSNCNADKKISQKPNANKNQCGICGNRYGNQYTLNYHMQLAHSLSCMYCDFKTTDRDALEVHVSQHMTSTDVKADRASIIGESPKARASQGKKFTSRKRLSHQFEKERKKQLKKESNVEAYVDDHERRIREREFWKSQDIKLASIEKGKKTVNILCCQLANFCQF